MVNRMQRGTLLYILICHNYGEQDAARNVAVHLICYNYGEQDAARNVAVHFNLL